MKLLQKLQLLTLILLGVLTFSCQDDTIDLKKTEKEFNTEVDISKLIDFKGLKVNHRFSTPVSELENELNFSKESIASRYNRISTKVNNAKLGTTNKQTKTVSSNALLADDDEIDYEVILEAKDRVIIQFPYQKVEEFAFKKNYTLENIKDPERITKEEFLAFENTRKLDSIALANYENDYLERQEQQAKVNFEMIQQDFPNLTESQIEENIEVIDNYYQQNLEYVLLENVAENGADLVNRQSKASVLNKTNYDDLTDAQEELLDQVQDEYGYTARISAGLSGKNANEAADDYFENLPGDNDRRDAFRHLVWNAYLAKNYVTLSSSISKRTDFAKFVTDTYEEITEDNRDVDSQEMDYHNNAIGRKIYRDNTSYLWLIGINEPSYSSIKSIAYDYVNKKSCFLRKTIADGANRIYEDYEIQAQIIDKEENIVVYFTRPIAPSWYTLEWNYVTTEEYYYCNSDAERENAYVVEDLSDFDYGLCVCVETTERVRSYERVDPCSENN